MRRTIVALLSTLAAMAFMLVGGVASAGSASAAEACASGYVCIYQGDIADGGTNHPIVARYYNYGAYNLSNFVGEYTVRNCQTGGAKISGYSGYGATGSVLWTLSNNCASGGAWLNLTPTNSVRLYP